MNKVQNSSSQFLQQVVLLHSSTTQVYNPGKPPSTAHSPLILGFEEVIYRLMSARRKSEVEFSLTMVPPMLL
ncbi:hypothetical protein Hanom_Chr08g00702141 [Helianthus anomalus]